MEEEFTVDSLSACEPGPTAMKRRNQCCHKRGTDKNAVKLEKGLDSKSCEADEGEQCEGTCFMLDKSEGTGGHKMCKPVCDARRLLTEVEAKQLEEHAAGVALKAADDLAAAKVDGGDTTQAEEELAVAEGHKLRMADVVAKVIDIQAAVQMLKKGDEDEAIPLFKKDDEPADDDNQADEDDTPKVMDDEAFMRLLKKEEDEILEEVKKYAVNTCKALPRDKRLACCGEECRKQIDEYFPGEERNISPMKCALPCNNA